MSVRFKLFLTILIGFASTVYAQSQNTINITSQPSVLTANFLKMGTNTSPNGEVFSYNHLYLTKDGKPWFPIMGEIHFSRVKERNWEEEILKMKAAGIEIISTYIFWNYVEPKEGVFDWTKDNNIQKFLSLCHKHGMYVWLRIGPWVHGEVRYGGFPDWLINKKTPLRRNNPSYLRYVKLYFDALGKQSNKFVFKEGGPIIGLQIENELVFKRTEDYEHMKTLKSLAVNAGFDVPYYSAFAQGPDKQDEFIYTIGGYPDSPWGSHTNKMYKPVYYIRPLEADTDIGSDLFGKVDGKVRNTYPKLSAELGAGMQPTYHRRVDVSSKDLGAVAFTKIAAGLNGLGYYMFHGGENKIGNTSLQESRITGYPNDVPYINYDFNSPIGAMGIIDQSSFTEFRLLHSFVKDFGGLLTTQKPYFTETKVSSPFSYDTVQVSVRFKDDSGFIFLSNYQRHVNLPSVKNFQLHLRTPNGTENVPKQPVVFPSNSYVIWPYNLPVGVALLHYATAQPLFVLNSKDQNNTYVFFADDESEFVFDESSVRVLESVSNCSINGAVAKVNTEDDKIAVFNVIASDNKTSTIIVLSRSKALQSSKVTVSGKEILLISDGIAIQENEKLTLEKTALQSSVFLETYPNISIVPISNSFTVTKQKSNSIFTSYQLSPKIKLTAQVKIAEGKVFDVAEAKLFEDSVLKSYATIEKSKFNAKQPGNIYQLKFHNLPGQHTYQLSFTAPVDDLVKDWEADFSYVGDVIALYQKDSLVYDQFNYDNHLKVRLGYLFKNPSTTLSAQVLPFKKEHDVYVEDRMRESKEKDWEKARLNQIILTPVYRFELLMKL